jgi:hypothetical protein
MVLAITFLAFGVATALRELSLSLAPIEEEFANIRCVFLDF